MWRPLWRVWYLSVRRHRTTCWTSSFSCTLSRTRAEQNERFGDGWIPLARLFFEETASAAQILWQRKSYASADSNGVSGMLTKTLPHRGKRLREIERKKKTNSNILLLIYEKYTEADWLVKSYRGRCISQPIIGHKHYFMTKTRTTVEVYKFNEHI